MKILIAYDGSSCADLALEDMRRAGLPRLASVSAATAARAHCSVEVVRLGRRAE